VSATTKRSKKKCKVKDCGAPAYCRGWCARHYHRWWRHGSPTIFLPGQEEEREISDIDAAWFACLIDGEGSCSIARRSARKHQKSDNHWPVLEAANTDRRLLEKAQKIAGGWINKITDKRGFRPCYKWTLAGKALGPVLRAVIPYLIIKREQAEILLALRDEQAGSHPGVNGLARKTVARRERMRRRVIQLNGRRRDA